MKTRILKAFGFATFATASTFAFCTEIYGVDNLGPTNAGTNGDRVVKFDSANPNGTMTVLGSTGVTDQGFGGLDFDASGTLYGVTSFGNSFTGSKLYKVSTTTGAATLVGSLGLTAGSVNDLSWNPVTGQMQALVGNGAGSNSLFNINLSTGFASFVGNITNFSSGLAVGLSTDSAGNNYLHDIVSDSMFKLNGLSANAMSSGVGLDCNFSQGMTMNWSNGNAWYVGTVSANPSFYGDLRQMNIATGGTSSVLGVWPMNGNGLPEYEMGDLAIKAVPEPFSLVALGAGLAALARRKRK